MRIDWPITVQRTEDEVDAIRELAEANDAEMAHTLEDTLFRAVLQTIASGKPGTSEAKLAAAALKATYIRYPRYYA